MIFQPISILCCIALSIAARSGFLSCLVLILLTSLFHLFCSMVGLIFGLIFVRLDWTNEAVPIKQSASVAITMFSAWALVLAESVGAYFLRNSFNAVPFLFVLPLALCALLNRHLYTRGEKEFMDL